MDRRIAILTLALVLSACAGDAKSQTADPAQQPQPVQVINEEGHGVRQGPPWDNLVAAKAAADAGRYADALREYRWMDQHMPVESVPLYHSLMPTELAEWLALGEKYPPALAELKKLRDDKTRGLLQGEKDKNLFYEVVAFNEALGERAASMSLLQKLQQADTQFADTCGKFVLTSLVTYKDYKLARTIVGDPYKMAQDDTRMLNMSGITLSMVNQQNTNANPQNLARATAAMSTVLTTKVIEDIRQLVTIMHGANPREDTAFLITFTLDHIQDPNTRHTVKQALQGYPLP